MLPSVAIPLELRLTVSNEEGTAGVGAPTYAEFRARLSLKSCHLWLLGERSS